jgi:hypothetical protein
MSHELLATLALALGLLVGRRRWAWMIVRAMANLGIIARLPIRDSRRARAGAAALGLLTIADVRVAIALRVIGAPTDASGSVAA